MSIVLPRRQFVSGMAFSGAALALPLFTTRGLFAEELTRTPRQTEGPFYPDKMPLDTDNDLLVINDNITPAVGTITHLGGRVLSTSGAPIRNAVVEIWQVDKNGVYIHSRDAVRGGQDKNFQGFGRFLTNAKGEYYFRTIKPVPYGPRTPHIHFAVYQGGKRTLTTQLYIAGEPQNRRDGIFRSLGEANTLCSAEFKPMKDSRIGELICNWDIVVGATPEQA